MQKYYDPLSDMSRIKESLMSLFCDTQDITRLIMPRLDDSDFTWEENWYGGRAQKTVSGTTKIVDLPGHCFDTPYIEGLVTDSRCVIFVETSLLWAKSRFIKEVGVEVSVVCHKSAVKLSPEDMSYYHSIGIYGNRIDCTCQAVNSAILSPDISKAIMKKYSIGTMNLSTENPIRLYVPGTDFYGKILSYTYQTNYQTGNGIRG